MAFTGGFGAAISGDLDEYMLKWTLPVESVVGRTKAIEISWAMFVERADRPRHARPS
ncbi:hypothetical protein [Lentzea sp. NPDC055074]